MNGIVFNIQRFSTGDGPGIRSVVFLKGCPISCVWCHNPEAKSQSPDIFYDSTKCINCRKCEVVCPQKQHTFTTGNHIFLRNDCKKCTICASVCPTNALELCGKEITCDEVVEEILKDSEFYTESGGGITISGGEPLFQYDFSLDILKKCKEKGVHTAIETCGYCSEQLLEISRYVDLWLYDIKLMSESDHIRYTGVSNKIILDNLHFLDKIGAKIILRCPIIPGINLNSEHFDDIATLANELNNVVAVHFEPYHPLGIEKTVKLGKIPKYENKEFLNSDTIQPFVDRIKNKTNVDIQIL